MRFIEIIKKENCGNRDCAKQAEYLIKEAADFIPFCSNHAMDVLTRLEVSYDRLISDLIVKGTEKTDFFMRLVEERKRCEDAIKELEKE